MDCRHGRGHALVERGVGHCVLATQGERRAKSLVGHVAHVQVGAAHAPRAHVAAHHPAERAAQILLECGDGDGGAGGVGELQRALVAGECLECVAYGPRVGHAGAGAALHAAAERGAVAHGDHLWGEVVRLLHLCEPG